MITKAKKSESPKALHFNRAPRGKSAFRHEIVELHREIFQRNREQINCAVFGYTPEFTQYEDEYKQAVAHYQRRAHIDELDRAIARSCVVYVGDYHTLSQAQRSFLRLLRRLPPDRKVTLALEFIRGSYQKQLDDYMAGRLSEHQFLKRIKYDSNWGFESWMEIRQVLDLARQRGYSVIGTDSASRGPAGKSLARRDRYAARKISNIHRQQPDTLIMVLIGEMHIAPSHLPLQVDHLLERHGVPTRSLVVYQNSPEIYWSLQKRGREHDTALVRISTREYCMLNTPPIVCQQSFLNWLEVDDTMEPLEALEAKFKEYVGLIATFFDLPVGEEVDDVEVVSIVDLSFLQRLRRRGDFSASDMQEIKKQILSSESCYIPRARTVYLGNLSINHASEEATHFLRHICSGCLEPQHLVDAFYARALEETVGFLGSKLLNHKRKCPHVGIFEKSRRSRTTTPAEKRLAQLVVKHHRLQSGARVRGINEIYECNVDLFNAITHIVGYQLGDRLYYGLIDGVVDKSEIRDLFFDNLQEEGSALATYLYLSARTQNVEIPERL